jgi:hypothetical protein
VAAEREQTALASALFGKAAAALGALSMNGYAAAARYRRAQLDGGAAAGAVVAAGAAPAAGAVSAAGAAPAAGAAAATANKPNAEALAALAALGQPGVREPLALVRLLAPGL